MTSVVTPRPAARAIWEVDPSSANLPSSMSHMRVNQLTINTMSPVTQNGSFEHDRIIKQGEVLKRTRKTKQWKPVCLLLRPNVLSIYSDKDASKLRHRIILSDLTAVARQTDPKRRDKHIFGLFSPSRNFHLETTSDQDAHDWVEVIRQEARMDEKEEEMMLASPGGAHTSPYQGFERSMDAHTGASADDRTANRGGYASSSDADNLGPTVSLPRVRTRDSGHVANYAVPRHPSFAEYSGADRTSMSDFSDSAGPAARLSALSLAQTDPRPSTSSTMPHPPAVGHSVYGTSAPARPTLGARNPSQLSTTLIPTASALDFQAEERVIHSSHFYLLKSHRGVRSWKKVWLVVRPKGVSLYKNSDEYAALLVLGVGNIIDAVEVDPISKSKQYCFMIITEEKNYKLSAMDEEGLVAVLGALKSLITKRRAKRKEREGAAIT